MYRNRHLFIVAGLCLLIAACSSPGERAHQAADGGFTGMLHYSDSEDCPFESGCGPRFSLLDESLTQWTPLDGRFDSGHHNLVIEVDGRTTSMDRDHLEYFGEAAAPHAIKARRYRLLSAIPYHPFLVEQAGQFTMRKYGCESLWDKSYRWERSGERVHLIVRMTDTFHPDDPKPYLELTYDGESGHFLNEEAQPWGIDPCRERSG